MSEYIRFAKLPILLLVLFMIARLILGATGVPYQSGTIVSMVSLAWVSAFFFGAFSRRLRGYSLKQAALLGLTIALCGQVLIFAATLVSYLVGAETYFNHPTALNQTEAVAMGPAVLARVGGLVANSIIGSIWGLLGWTGASCFPRRPNSKSGLGDPALPGPCSSPARRLPSNAGKPSPKKSRLSWLGESNPAKFFHP